MNEVKTVLAIGLVLLSIGCRPSTIAREDVAVVAEGNAEASIDAISEPIAIEPPVSYPFTAEQLLTARLPHQDTKEGVIRLFDTATLFGWEIFEAGNWRVEDQAIVIAADKPTILATSASFRDVELTFEIQAEQGTEARLLLRAPFGPKDVVTPSVEIDLLGAIGDDQSESENEAEWLSVKVAIEGEQAVVNVADLEPVEVKVEPIDSPRGRIAFRLTKGLMKVRDIRARPLGFESLVDGDLSKWKQYPDMDGKFEISDGRLHIQGGLGQLESASSFGDFAVLVDYQLANADVNSGLFFRCIPGDRLMGYECQMNHSIEEGDPLRPADCGSGGIFRRQDARAVLGLGDEPTTLMLIADGPSISAWVNGVQVSNWYDSRESDENPRRGQRLEPGTLMIQAHDPTTELWIDEIKVAELR